MTADEGSRSRQRNVAEHGGNVFAVQDGSQHIRVSPPPALPPTPRELPPDVSRFTGRAAELDELDRLLTQANEQPTVVLISAISGTAGVGKSALAVHWAHHTRRRDTDPFPDGCIYLDLRGYDPGPPVDPAEALAALLPSLGVDDANIPAGLAERVARYRSLLDGRRMLLVLDNAHNAEQVRPLLPGTPSCLVLVTSRDDLAPLVVQYGAFPIDLDLLPLKDAVALLRKLLGEERIADDPAAAEGLAESCARLPLALRIVAAHAATRRAATLADVVQELADEQHRLDLLKVGEDPRTAVRVAFSWSYQHLPAEAARVFRLLGPHPGRDIDRYAAAALTDTTLPAATQALDTLSRAHLIQQTGPNRFGMHDLLRAYAAEQAAHDLAPAREAALTRLFELYLHTAATAMDTLYPSEQHRRPRVPVPPTPAPPVADPTTAKAWLDAERPNLLAAVAHAAGHGWPTHAHRLATTLWRYLNTGGHYNDALTIHSHALNAARTVGDRGAEGNALFNLGSVYFRMGRYEQAGNHSQQALALVQEIGDRDGEGHTLNNLGQVYWRLGRHDEALEHYEQTLAIRRELGDRGGEAATLNNLGIIYWRWGRYDQAADHYQQALTIAREMGRRDGEAVTLANLGEVYHRVGRYEEAMDHCRRALALYREVGDRFGEVDALTNLGLVYERMGDYAEARDHHQQALTIAREIGARGGEGYALVGLGATYRRVERHQEALDLHQQALIISREVGDPCLEAEALNGFGETLRAFGKTDDAKRCFESALALAGEAGHRYEQARALRGIAHTMGAASHPDQARQHWQNALAIYTDLGVPEAEEVRTRLADLDATQPA